MLYGFLHKHIEYSPLSNSSCNNNTLTTYVRETLQAECAMNTERCHCSGWSDTSQLYWRAFCLSASAAFVGVTSLRARDLHVEPSTANILPCLARRSRHARLHPTRAAAPDTRGCTRHARLHTSPVFTTMTAHPTVTAIFAASTCASGV